MRLRVLHVIESLEHGGAERVMLDLANRQTGPFEVAVCCMKRRGELEPLLDPGVVRFCMDKPEGNDPRPAWRLGRLIRQQHFDVVHSHGWGVLLDAALAARAGHAAGWVHTVHGPYPDAKRGIAGRLKDAVRGWLERRASRCAHRIVTVSDSLAARLGELGFEAGRVVTIHNGVEVSRPRQAGGPHDGLRLITVGRLAAVKNQEMMLEALARLAPRFERLELTVVGDGPLRAALERRAAELGIADRVRLLGFRQDVAEQLAAADVFLLTSWHEGISIALLEAMQAGLPAIATRVGGVPETLDDGLSGVLIEPGDVAGLTGAVELLALSPAERRRLGDNARRRAREQFSGRAMARRYAALYREAASPSASLPGVAEAAAGPAGVSAGNEPRGLRILYHHRTQGRGAEGLHIANIVGSLQQLGHDVTVVSPAGVDPLATAGAAPVDKVDVPTRGVTAVWKAASRWLPGAAFELAEISYNAMAFRRLRRELDARDYDIVYERYAFYMIAGAWLARRRRIPFVLEANEVSGLPERARRQRFPRLCGAFERFLFRRCTAVLTVSSHLRRRALLQGLAPEQVEIVPNAIDRSALRPVRRRVDLVRRYGLEDRTVIGFAGWFDHWDRLDLLVEALARLKPEFPQLTAMLVGDGPPLTALRRRAAELGIAADVVTPGAVPRDQLHEHLALLDVAVVPHSNRFGSPVVLFEFMARRLPIVAPRLEPIEDVLEHGRTGQLFAPLDVDGLAESLRTVLRAPRLRRAMAAAAYDRLVTHHTWERNAERIIVAAGLDLPAPECQPREELRRVG